MQDYPRIMTLAQWAGPARWQSELPHSRETHAFVWVTRGQGRCLLEGLRRGVGVHNALVIPAGTYAGQDSDVVTTSLPVVAYATTKMSDDTAYTMTKTFWEEREALADSAKWWAAVTPELLENITTQIHPGALRYYEEIGAPITDAQR